MLNDRDAMNQPVDTLASDTTAAGTTTDAQLDNTVGSQFDNQAAISGSMGQQQYMEGTSVYDVNGDKVGTVSEHGIQNNCLVVHHGLFRDDVYVPLNAIDSQDANGVYLNITKDDVLNGTGMDTASGTSGAGMSGAIAAGGRTEAAMTDRVTDRTDIAETEATDVRVPVREEELIVGKQQNEVGRVHLHKDVVEEQESVTAPVTREEVRVERVPVQGQYSGDIDADAFTEKDIDVPVMGEQLVSGKRTVVNEEVRLSKQPVTEEQEVTDTVRKERVVVDGADQISGADDEYRR